MRTGVVREDDSEVVEGARCTIPADSWQMRTGVVREKDSEAVLG